MPTSISPVHLSGSTDGNPIVVAATDITSSPTTIHTAVSGTAAFDEITLFVSNLDSSPRTLSLALGGTTDPTHLICKAVSIPANSAPIPVVVGLRMNNGDVLAAAGSVTNILNITGVVNRIE
jgi:hypothetical protein